MPEQYRLETQENKMLRFTGSLAVVLVVVGIFQAAAAAQSGHTGTSTSQAVLNIRVQVVSASMLPTPPMSQNNQSISYSIPVKPVRLSVTEKDQLEEISDVNGRIQSRLVTTTTVVAK
jgi:hypothetical protein